MNTCSICKHEKRDEIEAALARNQSLRSIAKQFSVGDSAVFRHQQCIIQALQDASKATIERTQTVIEKEIDQVFVYVNKMFRACNQWLTDPDNPDEFTLDARTSEIEVIYDEEDGEYASGETKYKKMRAKLSTLLADIDAPGRNIIRTESKVADPRSLILETAKTLNGSIDRLAKLTGAYQEKRSNEHDRRNNREILIEALMILYSAKGQPKTRDDVEQEVNESMRAVNAVWTEAKDNAIRNGYIM